MSWSEERADERVEANKFSTEEITVLDLSKEMDFENLGTKDVRRGQGVHLYADVTNFGDIVANFKGDMQKQKKCIRAASVLRKVQTEILAHEDVARIQLQAVRLHAFCFKPYGDEAGRAKKSIATAIHINTYILDVFNPIFSELSDFKCSVGMASGETLIANVGARGERELISLGTPANLGAKILGGAGSIRITKAVKAHLPADVAKHFTPVSGDYPEEVFEANELKWSTHPQLAKALGVDFDVDKWKNKTEQYRDDLPLCDIELSDAEVKIDVELLSERNSKRVKAVVMFADLDGFTKYVQNAEDDQAVVDLVRNFHMMRAEFHAVASSDFDGLVIEHRGDCMILIAHLPGGDHFGEERAEEGVEIALGIQSSMEHVLQKYLGDKSDIHIAIGLDGGSCIVTRLGKKGDRQVVCLGGAVSKAELLQRETSGEDICVSAGLFNDLPKGDLKDAFEEKKDGTRLLSKMTFPRLKESVAKNAITSGAVKIKSVLGGMVVGKVPQGEEVANHLKNTNPWHSQ